MDIAFLAQMPSRRREPPAPVSDLKHFVEVLDTPALRLSVSTSTPCQSSAHGVIVGRIYSRHAMQPVATLSPLEWNAIRQTRGKALIDNFWGDYVAFIAVGQGDAVDRFEVIRAPFGRLGCYWLEHEETTTLASFPSLLKYTGLASPRIALMPLARHIAQPEMANDQTCLQGVRSLAGGDRLCVRSGLSTIDILWTPWRFCDDRQDIDSIAQAGEILRSMLIAAVAAQTAGHRHSILMLSGGLDSSVLAVCLKESKRSFEAVTLVTEAAVGDERQFARLAAQAVQVDLEELYRTLGGVDLTISRAALGPRPFARAFNQESERLAGQLADRVNADAIVDGGSGDNLFFNYMSLAAMVEILRRHGPSQRFWRSSAAFADLTGTSVVSVLAQTLYRAVTRNNRIRTEQRSPFLAPDIKHQVDQFLPHPWLAPPSSMGSGKVAQVAGLITTQANIEQGLALSAARPRLSLLVCQPVVETVLSLPIWCWFAPGHTRAAVRAGFTNDLPPGLIDRRSKGTPRPFMHDLYVHNRTRIRSMLLDGYLAGSGLLDLDMVRAMIDEPGPTRDLRYATIMDLVDAEAWARSWN